MAKTQTTKTMTIPQKIKNKIIDEAQWRATNGHGGVDQITYDNFIIAAEYGYSLQAPLPSQEGLRDVLTGVISWAKEQKDTCVKEYLAAEENSPWRTIYSHENITWGMILEKLKTLSSGIVEADGKEKAIYPLSQNGLDDMLTDFIHDHLKECGYSTDSEGNYDKLSNEQKKRIIAATEVILNGIPSQPKQIEVQGIKEAAIEIMNNTLVDGSLSWAENRLADIKAGIKWATEQQLKP